MKDAKKITMHSLRGQPFRPAITTFRYGISATIHARSVVVTIEGIHARIPADPVTPLHPPSKQSTRLDRRRRLDRAAMGGAPSKPMPRSEMQGSVTACASKSGGECRRVCVGVATSASLGRRVCAVGDRKSKRAACVDACACACSEVFHVPVAKGLGKWWRANQLASNCRRDCVPACDQPGRVARSQFSAPI